MRIFKYPIATTDIQEVAMPIDARILCVQLQNDVPCLWAEVDPDAAEESRLIITYGTGQPMASHREYIGTYQIRGGSLVFHVYEGES